MDDSLEAVLGNYHLRVCNSCTNCTLALKFRPVVFFMYCTRGALKSKELWRVSCFYVECVGFYMVCTEKATNPRNTYEDWEFIMAFCDKVNADLQG